jgi:hypothetical protein
VERDNAFFIDEARVSPSIEQPLRCLKLGGVPCPLLGNILKALFQDGIGRALRGRAEIGARQGHFPAPQERAQDDELEPMTERSEQQPQRPRTER